MQLKRPWIKKQKILLPMQPGDVPDTHANVEELIEEFDYKPTTNIQDGIQYFVTGIVTTIGFDLLIINIYIFEFTPFFCSSTFS